MTAPGPEAGINPAEAFQAALRGLRAACESTVDREGITTIGGWMTHERTELHLLAGGIPDNLYDRRTLEAAASPGEPTDPAAYADHANRAILNDTITFLNEHVELTYFLRPPDAPESAPEHSRRVTVIGRFEASGLYQGDEETRYTGNVDVYNISEPDERTPSLTIVGVKRMDNQTRLHESILLFCQGDDVVHVEYIAISPRAILLSDEGVHLFGPDTPAANTVIAILSGRFQNEAQLDAYIHALWEASQEIPPTEEVVADTEAAEEFRAVIQAAIEEHRRQLDPDERLIEELNSFLLGEEVRRAENRTREEWLAEVRAEALSIKYMAPSRLTLPTIARLTDFARSLRPAG
jgi:hypothetical protein